MKSQDYCYQYAVINGCVIFSDENDKWVYRKILRKNSRE